uniref:Troponin C n=1 Tax=Macrostomum lignano TaxID=282301 RepID=A0A1I8HPY9_9PLAT
MLSESDTDASGSMDFVEFASLMSRLCKPEADVRQQLVSSFQVFDKDQSGYLDREELRDAIYSMGSVELSEEEFDELLSAVDKNGDGRIDYEEFAAILLTDINQLIQTTKEEMRRKGHPAHPEHPEHPEHPDQPDKEKSRGNGWKGTGAAAVTISRSGGAEGADAATIGEASVEEPSAEEEPPIEEPAAEEPPTEEPPAEEPPAEEPPAEEP